MSEMFTDRDNFVVTFSSQELPAQTKIVMLATTLLVDIVYFENNQSKVGAGDLFD